MVRDRCAQYLDRLAQIKDYLKKEAENAVGTSSFSPFLSLFFPLSRTR